MADGVHLPQAREKQEKKLAEKAAKEAAKVAKALEKEAKAAEKAARKAMGNAAEEGRWVCLSHGMACLQTSHDYRHPSLRKIHIL
jgi:predicted Zn-dependent protease